MGHPVHDSATEFNSPRKSHTGWRNPSTDSPLGQFVLAGSRRPGEEAHVPRGPPGVLAAVGALLRAEEGVEVAPAAAVVELHARFLIRVVPIPLKRKDTGMA